MSDAEMSLEQIVDMLTLKNIKLPIEYEQCDSPVIFKLLNGSLEQRHKRKQLLLPNFENTESVAVFSDYGGESKGSKYYTYSFVFADYDGLGYFRDKMKIIRENYGIDNPRKEISFKDAHYGQMFRCIDEYLLLAHDMINGLVITVAVDKEIVSITGANNKNDLKKITEESMEYSSGKWKPATLEKSMRVISILTYFIKLLVPSGKKVFWMTDQDAIMANESKTADTSQWISNSINMLKDAPNYKFIGYTPKPYDGEEAYFLTDILSIADLSAGSVEQLLTRRKEGNETLTPIAEKVMQWSSVQGIGLNKLIFVVEKDNDTFTGKFLEPEYPEYIKKAVPVDYVYDVELTKNQTMSGDNNA